MATIRTAIELQDNFTSVLYQVINSVNLGLSAMEDLHQTMNSPVDTASIEAARDSINQATIAVQQLDAAMQGIETPETQTPTAPQSSAPVVLPVQPDVPDPLVEQPPPVDVPIEPEQPEPVEVPVHWQSDGLEVFTNSGVERFEQEVQSANNMLNTLNQTQERIVQTAADMDFLPPGGFTDFIQYAKPLASNSAAYSDNRKQPPEYGYRHRKCGIGTVAGAVRSGSSGTAEFEPCC